MQLLIHDKGLLVLYFNSLRWLCLIALCAYFVGRESTIPDENVLESKEQSDREQYREMLESIDPSSTIEDDFVEQSSWDDAATGTTAISDLTSSLQRVPGIPNALKAGMYKGVL